jgi:hypothetical protein
MDRPAATPPAPEAAGTQAEAPRRGSRPQLPRKTNRVPLPTPEPVVRASANLSRSARAVNGLVGALDLRRRTRRAALIVVLLVVHPAAPSRTADGTRPPARCGRSASPFGPASCCPHPIGCPVQLQAWVPAHHSPHGRRQRGRLQQRHRSRDYVTARPWWLGGDHWLLMLGLRHLLGDPDQRSTALSARSLTKSSRLPAW